MVNYYQPLRPQKKPAAWWVWCLAILIIGGLAWSLSYVSKKLENRQARLQYWQDQEDPDIGDAVATHQCQSS